MIERNQSHLLDIEIKRIELERWIKPFIEYVYLDPFEARFQSTKVMYDFKGGMKALLINSYSLYRIWGGGC